MSAHPLSAEMRDIAGEVGDCFSYRQGALIRRAADALDSAATFEANVLRIRGEIEWLTEENGKLRRLAESAYGEGYDDGLQDGDQPKYLRAKRLQAWLDSNARAALPAERDEKEETMSKKKSQAEEWSPERFVTEALERIEVLRKHMGACESAAYHLRNRDGYYRETPTGWEELRRGLMQAELDEWRNVMMFGLVVDQKKRDRIKAAAHQRFLSDEMAVSHWWNDGTPPGQWLVADEDKFREMIRKAFAPKENQ